MTPDAQWHWEQGNKYALEGMKVLLALNGGAAIAFLTFTGHASSPLAIARVGYALLSFGIGALCAVLVFLTAYLTQLCYGNNDWPRAQRYHNVSYIVVTFSVASFLFGIYFAYSSLPG